MPAQPAARKETERIAIDKAFLVMALYEGDKEDRRRAAAEHPGRRRKFHTFERKRSHPARCTPAFSIASRPDVLRQATSKVRLRSAARLRFRLRLLVLYRPLRDMAARFLVLRDKRI